MEEIAYWSLKLSKWVGHIDEEIDPRNDPYMYFSSLPEPFSFIVECLEDLIVKNAMEKIVQIEKWKQSIDFEGGLKEVYASGVVEIDGITSTASLKKSDLNDDSHRYIMGDKKGKIFMLDASWKIILD